MAAIFLCLFTSLAYTMFCSCLWVYILQDIKYKTLKYLSLQLHHKRTIGTDHFPQLFYQPNLFYVIQCVSIH